MNPNYSTTFTVDNSPAEAFAAISNPRGWWSQEIEGDTNQLGAEFKYHYKDVHRAAFKITEWVPNKRVVWHVLENHFNFIKDQSEWVDTDVIFEVVPKDGKTEVQFTHVGLVPDYECYDVCANAWGTYISRSLRDLITTGKGQPNPIEEVVNKAQEMSEQNYTTFITLDQSPDEVFAAVNNVRGWWSDDIEGDTDYLGATFKFHSKDLHHSTQKVTEFVPGKKIVWHVTESQINFVEDKEEWKGTDIVFDISKQGAKTELRFTHVGLAPVIACYAACSDAWGFYINVSLFNLIASGKGHPDYKQELPA